MRKLLALLLALYVSLLGCGAAKPEETTAPAAEAANEYLQYKKLPHKRELFPAPGTITIRYTLLQRKQLQLCHCEEGISGAPDVGPKGIPLGAISRYDLSILLYISMDGTRRLPRRFAPRNDIF